MQFFKKYKIFFFVGIIGVFWGCILNAKVLYADAAEFKHVHTDSCYQMATVPCTSTHQSSTRSEGTTAHCSNCNTQTSQTIYVHWDQCFGTGEEYELGGYRVCNICGATGYSWGGSATGVHQVSQRVLSCGKDGATAGTVTLINKTSGWTRGNVRLAVAVNISDASFSLHETPYSWDNGKTWTTEKAKTVTANGNYKVLVRDANGTMVEETVAVSNIDATLPTISNVKKSEVGWTKSDVILTVEALDTQPDGSNGSGLDSNAYSFDNGATYKADNRFTATENGSYIIRVKDKAGNIGKTQVKVSNIDRTAPTVSKVVKNTDTWTNKSVKLTVQASDKQPDGSGGSGLAAEAYSFDNGATYQSGGSFTVTKNGTYKIKVRDKVGNVTQTQIKVDNIDNVKPTITEVKKSKSTWTKDGIMLTVCAEDKQSGVSAASGLGSDAYSFDNGATFQGKSSFEVVNNGIYTIKVKDQAGNVTQTRVTVDNIDNVSPTIISVEASEKEWTNQRVMLTVDAKDLQQDGSAGSGLAPNAYSYDGGVTFTEENSHEVTENGIYQLCVQDALGNVSTTQVEVTNIDYTGPSLISQEKSEEDWTKQDLILSMSAEDTQPDGSIGSGLAEQPFSFDGGITYTAESAFAVSENGTYTVYMKDRLGNVGEARIEITNIDSGMPVIENVEIEEAWQREKVTIYVQAKDEENGSGLHVSPYSLDGEKWQEIPEFIFDKNGSYKIFVRDYVGNISSQEFLVSQLDTTAPVIEEVQVNQDKIEEDKVEVTIIAKDYQPDGTFGSGLHEQAYSSDGGKNWQKDNVFVIENGTVYDFRVRDALLWESDRLIADRNDFPYPPDEEETSEEETEETSKEEIEETSKEEIEETSEEETEETSEEEIEETSEEETGEPTDETEEEKSKESSKEAPKKPTEENTEEDSKDDLVEEEQPTHEKSDANKLSDEDKTANEIKKIVGEGQNKNDSEEEEIRTEKVLLQENSEPKEVQQNIIRLPWYITPVGKVAMISAGTLTLGGIGVGIFYLFLFSVSVYSFDEKKVQIKLGRVLLHRTKEGYSVYLPEFMLEKAFIPRYRIKVSAFLLKRVENARLLVQSDEKNLEVLIQETIDFEL